MYTDEELKALVFTESITDGFEIRILKLYKDMKVILEKEPSPFIDTDNLYWLMQFYKKVEDYVIDMNLI